MIKVGISGKIASGKSEVEKILKNKGFLVFDLDEISHKLFEENNEVKAEILNNFHTLDRKKVGEIVFCDEKQKKNLENIIYPKLKNEIFSIFEKCKKEKMIFISGALLFKSGFSEFFNKTIFIQADDEIRLERLMKRNKFSKQDAQKRLNLQDDSTKADFIIENNDDFNKLETKIDELLRILTVF